MNVPQYATKMDTSGFKALSIWIWLYKKVGGVYESVEPLSYPMKKFDVKYMYKCKN